MSDRRTNEGGGGLLELCEPLFAYVCTLNRAGRSRAALTPERVRGELEAIFDNIRSEAAGGRGLSAQFNAVEEALHGFVDSMIQRSTLPFAGAWRPLSWSLPDADRAFEDMFYIHLDRAMQERGPEADERLAVYYTCLCLGFRGDPSKRTPEFLTAQLDKVLPAIKRYQVATWSKDTEKICPGAYDHTDERVLWRPLGVPLSMTLLVLVLSVIVIFATTTVVYWSAREELVQHLKSVGEEWPVQKESGGGG